MRVLTLSLSLWCVYLPLASTKDTTTSYLTLPTTIDTSTTHTNTAGWKPGKRTMKADPIESLEYFQARVIAPLMLIDCGIDRG